MISALIGIKEISQRVKNKNFLDVGGKPLFFWIINTLNNTKNIDEIILNVDGKNLIQMINKEFKSCDKLQIIEREEKIKGHDVSMNLIIENSLQSCKNEIILNTHTTNPFIKPETINNAIDFYHKIEQPIFSVVELKNRFYDKLNNPINHDIDNLIPTQNLEPLYQETSTFYIFSKKQFYLNNNRLNADSKRFIIPKIESIDIDDYEDLEISKLLEVKLKSE